MVKLMDDKTLFLKEVQDKRLDFLKTYHEYWTNHAFLTWQWWFLLLSSILMCIVWIKKVDRRRTHLILNYGFIFESYQLCLI